MYAFVLSLGAHPLPFERPLYEVLRCSVYRSQHTGVDAVGHDPLWKGTPLSVSLSPDPKYLLYLFSLFVCVRFMCVGGWA